MKTLKLLFSMKQNPLQNAIKNLKKNHRSIKMIVSCKTRNHPQTSQTTHKPAKPPTNHSQTSQNTLKLAKYETNHPLISQKLHHFFHEDTFCEPQHFPCLSRAKRELGAFFDVPARFRISPSPLHNSLPSLIADYNPSNKLLTQLQT